MTAKQLKWIVILAGSISSSFFAAASGYQVLLQNSGNSQAIPGPGQQPGQTPYNQAGQMPGTPPSSNYPGPPTLTEKPLFFTQKSNSRCIPIEMSQNGLAPNTSLLNEGGPLSQVCLMEVKPDVSSQSQQTFKPSS